MNQPLFFEIKGNSLDDGPGIRTVVFFKGCPLSCAWCHNPEGRSAKAEISYDMQKCIGCGNCIKNCREKAVAKKNKYFINRDRCTLCLACADECPSGAISRVGFTLSFSGIVSRILDDKPFFDNSGGGVTLSGGEPTLHMEYAAELAGALREKGIHTLLETCGLFNYRRFKELLYPFLSAVYFDIKLFAASEHRQFCGVDNEAILDNFSTLQSEASNGGVPVLPRIPLIPGITDTDANLKAIAGFLKNQGVTKVALLPYNPLWHEKSRSIGCQGKFSDYPEMSKFMPRERIQRCKDIFLAAGISQV